MLRLMKDTGLEALLGLDVGPARVELSWSLAEKLQKGDNLAVPQGC